MKDVQPDDTIIKSTTKWRGRRKEKGSNKWHKEHWKYYQKLTTDITDMCFSFAVAATSSLGDI